MSDVLKMKIRNILQCIKIKNLQGVTRCNFFIFIGYYYYTIKTCKIKLYLLNIREDLSFKRRSLFAKFFRKPS